jgi:hypothetical protein
MKKYLSMMTMLMLGMLAFTACGSDDDDDPSPTNLKTNILYATFSDGKTAEIEIVGIGGNANNPQSADENQFTFYDGPCDVHLDCNFKTGKGIGDIELMDRESAKEIALDYTRVGGEFTATKCRYEKGILYFHIEGSGYGYKKSEGKVSCTFKADVKQTGKIYYPQQ